jgi:hypothetical protein
MTWGGCTGERKVQMPIGNDTENITLEWLSYSIAPPDLNHFLRHI